MSARANPEERRPAYPELALYRAGLLSPLRGEDAQTWIAHHYQAHEGDWGPCMEGLCGVLVRVIRAWEEAIRPRVEAVVRGPVWPESAT